MIAYWFCSETAEAKWEKYVEECGHLYNPSSQLNGGPLKF